MTGASLHAGVLGAEERLAEFWRVLPTFPFRVHLGAGTEQPLFSAAVFQYQNGLKELHFLITRIRIRRSLLKTLQWLGVGILILIHVAPPMT